MAELQVTTHFHAQPGQEATLENAVRGIVVPVRDEPACLRIEAFVDANDPHGFFITSRWRDASGYRHHRELAHTLQFLELARTLVDQPIVSNQLTPLADSGEA